MTGTLPSRHGPPAFTVSAELILGLIDCAVRCGVPHERFVDILGQRAGPAPPSRYPAPVIFQVWERIARLSGDPIVGHRMALVAELKTLGTLGTTLPRCATVLEALHQMQRYSALSSQGARLQVEATARELSVTVMLTAEAGALRSHIMYWALTNLGRIPGLLSRSDARPLALRCSAAEPDHPALRELLAHGPFRFRCDQDQVLFAPWVAHLGIPSADADLRELLDEVMDRHLAALGPAASFEQGLCAILREMLTGSMPTLASLSRRSGLSRRTLQRRLGESGTSFRELLCRVLHQQAEELLARGDLSQGEIAFRLGYSEVSAFSRAYRGWTGHAPGGRA